MNRAKNINDYYAYLIPQPVKRNRTAAYVSNASETLKSYRRYGQNSESEFKSITREIEAAPHDDAISGIMCKLRHRVYG
jgi:hypothetical protein